MSFVHIDYPPTKECKHPEWTYGELCVKCGECGRYDVDYKCFNCGYTEGKKPLSTYSDWGFAEFYDVLRAPICPKCKLLFKEEDHTQQADYGKYGDYSLMAKNLKMLIKDFKQRSLEAQPEADKDGQGKED